MRLSDRKLCLCLIDGFLPLLHDRPCLRRISTAADAAARTRHDLDKLIIGGSVLYLFQQNLGILDAVCHGYLDHSAVQINLRFLDSLETADRCIV